MATREDHIESILLGLSFIQRRIAQNGLWRKGQQSFFEKMKLESTTPAQFRVLMGVMKHWGLNKRGPTVKELAEALAISSSAVTQAVDVLVRKNYLAREPDEEDRRAIIIRLSPILRQKTNEIKKLFIANSACLFEGLSDNELAQYQRLNKKLVKSLAENPAFDVPFF